MSYVIAALAVLAAGTGISWWWMNRPFGKELVMGESVNAETSSNSMAAQTSSSPAEPASWDAKIDAVLEENLEDPAIARRLIELLPGLPPDGQVSAVRHVCDLLDDKDHGIVLPLLLDSKLPEPVLTVLFTDLMNRSDRVKLFAWIELAKVPDHPFREEALDDLEIYAGHNYGTDYGAWNAAMEKYLQENPEEAAKL